jgi:hypothetical protein
VLTVELYLKYSCSKLRASEGAVPQSCKLFSNSYNSLILHKNFNYWRDDFQGEICQDLVDDRVLTCQYFDFDHDLAIPIRVVGAVF